MVAGERAATGHTLIGVVIGAASVFESGLVGEIYSCAEEFGHRVAVGIHNQNRPRARVVAELAEQGCAVVVVVGAEFDDRYEPDVPLVVVGERIPHLAAVTVGTDEWRGAQLAVQHLIDLGHTVIHHVEGGSHPCAAERLRGYRNAMAAAGLGDGCRTILGDYTEAGGAAAARTVLSDVRRPTAVFLANDRMAMGFLDVVRQEGIGVPDDMSVIGYDDGPFAALDHVSLTTVRQDVGGLARAAVAAAHAIIEGTDDASSTGGCGFYGAHTLEPELVVRGTTATPVVALNASRPTQRLRWGLLTDVCDDDLMLELGDPAIISGSIEVVASASTMVAWEIADRLGIMASYGIYDDLIDDTDIDAVYISLPHHEAETWSQRARDAGKVVRSSASAASSSADID